MNQSLKFVESSAVGISKCIALAHRTGQTYRLVFSFENGRKFTVQADLAEGEEEIGFLVFEENVYGVDPQSLSIDVPIQGDVSEISLYNVEGCNDPSRIIIQTKSGRICIISPDAFPYGISYRIDDVEIGVSQYDDREYRIITD